jgi:tetratricopeptide (TPR) repeat protein
MQFYLPDVLKAFLSTSPSAAAPASSAVTKATVKTADNHLPISCDPLNWLSGQGIVDQPIYPQQRGRIQFQGSWWYARCDQAVAIAPGEVVEVLGVRNTTLIVEPAFMLRASGSGLRHVQQLGKQRGWSANPDDWFDDIWPVLDGDLTQPVLDAVTPETWQRFVQRKPIYIELFKLYSQALGLPWQELVGATRYAPAAESSGGSPEVAPGSLFVGREGAIAQLHDLFRQGHRIVIMQAAGGVGKTTLARQFFAQAGMAHVLECWMPKTDQPITDVESLVQQWLQHDLGEPPGRDLETALQRLQQRLCREKIGVLIDNLESALDQQGQLVAEHQGYSHLLRVLADPESQAITLITTRKPLENTGISTYLYRLQGLEVAAWEQFFTAYQIPANPAILSQVHNAYSGNAKAMTIVNSTVRVDYGGDLENYWQDSGQHTLAEADLQDLVTNHFTRLQSLHPDAHRLLCRLGCYRYQDIPQVPVAGVKALLWEVPEAQHDQILRVLCNLSLVEVAEAGYSLHPVIQARAVALLRDSHDWELANRKAAEFWTASVATVTTPDDALRALEAYYHYQQIGDVIAAAEVILHNRPTPWQQAEPLGVAFYRLGLLNRMIATITPIIDQLDNGYARSKLHNILGDLHWLTGDIQTAIQHHKTSRQVAILCQLKDLEIVSLFNIGLCLIELGETEQAIALFTSVNTTAENTDYHKYAVGAWFCLAYLYSCQGNNKAAVHFVKKVAAEYSKIAFDSWSRGYSLLFLGRTFRNLGDNQKASQIYTLARHYAERSNYIQVKAGALNGLAEIHRDNNDLRAALSNHLAAKELLEKIEAKCDLAEVYYQLGLTHGKMQDASQSQANLESALNLFQQMGAARQIKKVREILQSPPFEADS